jgi:cellulose synthase/poly-beta-1,6-N-acetylglucosamine synthase-like glycosyltransferase
MHTALIAAQWFFWTCLFLVLYTYFFYPILLFGVYSLSQMRRDWRYLGWRVDRRAKSIEESQLSPVSLVVAAHNEELVLPAKIKNCRELDYPADKLELIFISDGSIDRTNQILVDVEDHNVHALLLTERNGKADAINPRLALPVSNILFYFTYQFF